MLIMPRPRLLLVVVVLSAFSGCGGNNGDDGDAGAMATADEAKSGSLAAVPRVYERLQSSVVAVLVRGEGGAGEGSGVVFERRRIITNNHVLAAGREISVALASGERIPAKLVARDPRTDLAVLDVERDLPPARFADELPRVGSLAIAIGNPLGFEGSVTAGIVSGVDRAIPSGGTTPELVNLIQTDAAISPGNSGGALVGADGKVIGINVAYIPPVASAVAIGFAIPSQTAVEVARQLVRDGEVSHAYLGAQLRPLTAQTAQALGLDTAGGTIVEVVAPGGPADDAGLRPGDIITDVRGRPLEQIEDILSALARARPGERLELQVLRPPDGDRRSITVELGRRPG
jgi:S1-C subfamily serine protease